MSERKPHTLHAGTQAAVRRRPVPTPGQLFPPPDVYSAQRPVAPEELSTVAIDRFRQELGSLAAQRNIALELVPDAQLTLLSSAQLRDLSERTENPDFKKEVIGGLRASGLLGESREENLRACVQRIGVPNAGNLKDTFTLDLISPHLVEEQVEIRRILTETSGLEIPHAGPLSLDLATVDLDQWAAEGASLMGAINRGNLPLGVGVHLGPLTVPTIVKS